MLVECSVCFVALTLCVATVNVIPARCRGCNSGANCVVCVPVECNSAQTAIRGLSSTYTV